jgi:hypothetical protein
MLDTNLLSVPDERLEVTHTIRKSQSFIESLNESVNKGIKKFKSTISLRSKHGHPYYPNYPIFPSPSEGDGRLFSIGYKHQHSFNEAIDIIKHQPVFMYDLNNALIDLKTYLEIVQEKELYNNVLTLRDIGVDDA